MVEGEKSVEGGRGGRQQKTTAAGRGRGGYISNVQNLVDFELEIPHFFHRDRDSLGHKLNDKKIIM